jgi:hypothetical protein
LILSNECREFFESFYSDIRKQPQKKAKEGAAGDEKNMKEDVEEEHLAASICISNLSLV